MIRSIIDVAVTTLIVVGSIVVAYVMYRHLNGAIHDPSVPHGTLWHTLFG